MTESEKALEEVSDELSILRDKILVACDGHNKGTIMMACMLIISIMIEDADFDSKRAALDKVQKALDFLRNLYQIPQETMQ